MNMKTKVINLINDKIGIDEKSVYWPQSASRVLLKDLLKDIKKL